MTFKAPDSRAYHLALERRKGEMGQFLNTFAQLLQAIIDRDHSRARDLLPGYGEHNCKLVLATLAER
jgi:DNA-binding GntR family transcriptional regulator